MTAPDHEREIRLSGGNVGGAVRIGNTVRRGTGPWTPAIHALLDYLATRIPGVPRVLGEDGAGTSGRTTRPPASA